ncbi:MAG: adenosine deaminase [Ruminococcus sp.]|nr:adenosine deaminase [Ruminococcus sp.]
MAFFGKLYLDKEKDIIIELNMTQDGLWYVLRTPNHAKGNLITNLARLCNLKLSTGANGLKVIAGKVPCYIDERNREVYVLRMADTKVANIYPDGTIERKAYIPAISKTLMSQTKDYRLDVKKTLVKTYIRREYKFRTDLHTHMNANLDADILIALGIFHQIRYPLYYIKKLGLRCTEAQRGMLERQRAEVELQFSDSTLTGKYLTRKIDDNTFINFADFILNNLKNAEYNIPKIRASLTILKDGQAVFTNLEKVYLYRYVFAKGQPASYRIELDGYRDIPDADISGAVGQMLLDSQSEDYAGLTLFQNKLLWIARGSKKRGVRYLEISDTTLVKHEAAARMLGQVHGVMPAVTKETGVTIRFLAAIRRIPLTIVRENALTREDVQRQLGVIRAVACDPYVSGSDIIGEEINDIRDLRGTLRGLVEIAGENPGFVIRIHAGENDGLRDNVANSLACVREALAQGQPMPPLRIGHGLYTANLNSQKGLQLMEQLRESGAVLEFQLTSNVRLNNLTALNHHPLRKYLRGGVSCVQGTDGGAIYGTDSIDEQLALERLLDLTYDDMMLMRRAEDKVLSDSMRVFGEKTEAFARLADGADTERFFEERILREAREHTEAISDENKLDSAECFKAQIRPIPTDKAPVILLGGSFNSSRHATRMKQPLRDLLSALVERLDPDKTCFVIGSRLTSYEQELVRLANGRFEVFAIVPTRVTRTEAARIKQSGVGVRVSIEPTRMGLYKSFAYEIFKRRPSVVIAMDGNSAGANTIQEAKNGKREARIFVYRHARVLYAKAQSIQGYVSVFEDDSAVDNILRSVQKVRDRMRQENQ